MTDQKDILDLLHRFVQTGGTNMLSAISLMKDAAAEIERLRDWRDERAQNFARQLVLKQLANEELHKWPNEAIQGLTEDCWRVARVVEGLELD